MDTLNTVNDQVNRVLQPIFQRDILAILFLLITLYGTSVLPQPCDTTIGYMQHPVIRFVFIGLAAYTGSRNTTLSLFLASAISLALIVWDKTRPETFQGPKTMIYPGCLNTTMADLLGSFDGNKDSLVEAMMRSRVPADIKLTDDFAPLIGTYLMSFGYKVKAPCAPMKSDQRSSAEGWITG